MLKLTNIQPDSMLSLFPSSKGNTNLHGVENIFASLLHSFSGIDGSAKFAKQFSSVKIDLVGDNKAESMQQLKSKILHFLQKRSSDPEWKNILDQWKNGTLDIYLPVQVQRLSENLLPSAKDGLKFVSKDSKNQIALLHIYKQPGNQGQNAAALKPNNIGLGFILDENRITSSKQNVNGNLSKNFAPNFDSTSKDATLKNVVLTFNNSKNSSVIIDKKDGTELHFISHTSQVTNKVTDLTTAQNAENTLKNSTEYLDQNSEGQQTDKTGIRSHINTLKTEISVKLGTKLKNGVDPTVHETHTLKVQNKPGERLGHQPKGFKNHQPGVQKPENISGLIQEDAKTRYEYNNPSQARSTTNSYTHRTQQKNPVAAPGKSISTQGSMTATITQNDLNDNPLILNDLKNSTQIIKGPTRENPTENNSSENAPKLNPEQLQPKRFIYVDSDQLSGVSGTKQIPMKGLSKLLEKLQGDVHIFTNARQRTMPPSKHLLFTNQTNPTIIRRTQTHPTEVLARPEIIDPKTKSSQTPVIHKYSSNYQTQKIGNGTNDISNLPRNVKFLSQSQQSSKIDMSELGSIYNQNGIEKFHKRRIKSTTSVTNRRTVKVSSVSKQRQHTITPVDRIRRPDYAPQQPVDHLAYSSLDSDELSNHSNRNPLLQTKTDLGGIIGSNIHISSTQHSGSSNFVPVMHQVIQRIEMMTQQFRSNQLLSRGNWLQARIALKPAELGSVLLALKFKDDVLQGKIFADNKQTKHIIEKHLPAIQEAMSKHQTTVQDIKVEVRPHLEYQEQSGFQHEFANQHDEAHQNHAFHSRSHGKPYSFKTSADSDTPVVQSIQPSVLNGQINYYA